MRSLEACANPNDANTVKIPLGRYGKTCDIAKLVLFLASEDSSL